MISVGLCNVLPTTPAIWAHFEAGRGDGLWLATLTRSWSLLLQGCGSLKRALPQWSAKKR